METFVLKSYGFSLGNGWFKRKKTPLNGKKGSVPDPVSLILGRNEWPGLTRATSLLNVLLNVFQMFVPLAALQCLGFGDLKNMSIDSIHLRQQQILSILRK